MQALRRELLPPSGVEFSASLSLTPATLRGGNDGKGAIRNLVVARSSFLRIFEVREEPAPLPSVEDAVSSGQKGMEAVEGEVEMDEQGEGFVSVGVVKVTVFTGILCKS
jgi:cleavage and polyadenylation specificity factor subunit 1